MYTRTHTKASLLFCIATLIFSGNAMAQNQKRITKSDAIVNTQSEEIIKQYADSLTAYRAKLDSVMALNDSLREADGMIADYRYYRIFAPMTYYTDVFGNNFRYDYEVPGTPSVNNALQSLYFKRPDLLRYVSSRLDGQKVSAPQPVKSNTPERIEMVKQVKAETALNKTPASEITNAPVDLYVEKPHFWTFKGDYYLQFMQTALSSNWYKSGSNSYSMLGNVTLQYNYNNKQRLKWDNKLEMKLGFQANEADTVNRFKSSEDLLRYTGKVGLQAFKSWYYTLQVVANTQFAKGLRNNNTAVFSDFMSPFNLNVSVGMDYTVATNNKRLTGSVHLAPLAFNFKYCDRKNLAPSFGITDGHRTLEDFGSTYTIDLTWKPFDMLKWQTRLYGYTTYHKYEMEWENTFTFTFNKYISAVVFLYPRFDDSAIRMEGHDYFQYKEYMSLGFSYNM